MILVVGGAGYIGSHVNKYLFLKKEKTLVLDNLSSGHREFCQWGEFVLGDIADEKQLDLIFRIYPITAVMHFSAFLFVGESVEKPLKYWENNVSNTLKLLKKMIENNVKYFIFSSSAAVYGIPKYVPIDEEHPTNPINPYGMTKLTVEKILDDFDKAYGLKYASLRYFNASGADFDCRIGERHNPETHLIPLVLDAAVGQKDYITIYGTDYNTPDGTCIRDYIHVDDLAEAHFLALNYIMDSNESQIFNLGNGKGFSVKEIVLIAERVTGKKIHSIYSGRREGDPDILIAGSEKARQLLDWEPRYSEPEVIIESAWNWHQKLQ